MYTVTPGSPDPQSHMAHFVSWEIAGKANDWAGRNIVRWANAEYDRLWKQAATELDPVRRAALFIRMNDLLIEDMVVIPVVWRNEVVAVSHQLRGLELTTWDSNLWDLAYWYREVEDAHVRKTPRPIDPLVRAGCCCVNLTTLGKAAQIPNGLTSPLNAGFAAA
jgi:ABC-type transport system substrate-binding protein